MKAYLLLILAATLRLNCLHKQNKEGLSYVKIFTIYPPDTVTAYNKGLGIANYAYYNPQTDSFLYRELRDTDPTGLNLNQYKTYTGILNNPVYVDTMLNLLQALSKYKNGKIPEDHPDGGTYCGPEFYVEYRDGKGEHFNLFILENNDTLDQFSAFFHRLPSLSWQKKLVSNNIVKADTEVVTAVKKLGLYEKQQTPYIPLPCEPGIDKNKIYGSWRMVNNGHWEPDTYYKTTFKRNGTCSFEHIKAGVSTSRGTPQRFILSTKQDTLILKIGTSRCRVLKLTETCLEYAGIDRLKYMVRCNRL